jgi:ATP-dependent protease Clp ATPase subunit
MAAADEDAPIFCSFCRKPTAEVGTMVAGAGVYICDQCVSLCAEIIANKPAQSDLQSFASWDERLSDDDLLGLLPQMVTAGEQVDRRLALTVTRARERGVTWTRIGGALGMTRQSAWERFSGEE